MAIAVVERGHAGPNAGTVAIGITGVNDGATLVVAVAQFNTQTGRTYSASSNVDGAFSSMVQRNTRGAVALLRKTGCTAGSHTITVAANTGTTNFWAWVFDATGVDTGPATVPSGNGFADAGATDNHFSAPVDEVAFSGEALLITVGVLESSVTSTAATGAFTKATAASNNQSFCQYRVAASAGVDRGAWDSVGTDRVGEATMVAIAAAGEGGGGGGAPGRAALSWWFGL